MCLARTPYNGYQRPAAPNRAAAAQPQRSVVLQQHGSASSHDGREVRKTTVCLVANNSLKTEKKTTVGTIRWSGRRLCVTRGQNVPHGELDQPQKWR